MTEPLDNQPGTEIQFKDGKEDFTAFVTTSTKDWRIGLVFRYKKRQWVVYDTQPLKAVRIDTDVNLWDLLALMGILTIWYMIAKGTFFICSKILSIVS